MEPLRTGNALAPLWQTLFAQNIENAEKQGAGMLSRRQVLQSGLAATSIPLIAGVSLAPHQSADAKTLEHPALYRVLFDQRFPASREFGRAAQSRGQNVQAFDGDVTHVWYHDLYPRWQQGPAAIAGLTAYSALFCLERLAWDVGMRVTYREERHYSVHEPLYSWVIAPRARVAQRA